MTPQHFTRPGVLLAASLVLMIGIGSSAQSNVASAATAAPTAAATASGTEAPNNATPYLSTLFEKHFSDGSLNPTNGMFDFDNPSSGPLGQLTTAPDSSTAFCSPANGNYDAISFGNAQWTDYSVEVRVKIAKIASKNKEGAMILRMRAGNSGISDYEAIFDNFWGLNLGYYDSIKQKWPSIGNGWVSIQPNNWYTLRAELSQTKIRIYAQGRLLLQTQSKVLTSGFAGIGGDPTTDICVSDIVVRLLDSSPDAIANATQKTVNKASAVRFNGIAKTDPVLVYVSKGDKVFVLLQSADGTATQIRIDKSNMQGWVPSEILQ